MSSLAISVLLFPLTSNLKTSNSLSVSCALASEISALFWRLIFSGLGNKFNATCATAESSQHAPFETFRITEARVFGSMSFKQYAEAKETSDDKTYYSLS